MNIMKESPNHAYFIYIFLYFYIAIVGINLIIQVIAKVGDGVALKGEEHLLIIA